MIMSDRPARTISRGAQAVMLLCALALLPLGVVYAGDPGYEAVGNRLIEAVRAGELAPEEAVAMMGELARSRFARRLGEELGRPGGPDAHEERRRAEFHEAERRIHEAVEAGKLSKEEARRKLEAVERELFGGRERGREDEREARFHGIERDIHEAVAAGKLSKEDARRKLETARRELLGGREKGPEDQRKAKYQEIERDVYAAVKAGKLSKEDARRKLADVKRDLFGGEERREERKGGGREDERMARLHAIEKDLSAAVKAGRLSKEDARRKLENAKRELFGGEEKRGERKEPGREDERAAKYREIEREIYAAVKAGKLSKEDARRKLENVKRELFGGDEKRGGQKEHGREDEREIKYRRIEKEIREAVEKGELSKKEAAKKLEALKREMFGGEKEPKRKRDERERN